MSTQYHPRSVEAEVQGCWEEARCFEASESDAEKFYCLAMFPYPSVQLHMG